MSPIWVPAFRQIGLSVKLSIPTLPVFLYTAGNNLHDGLLNSTASMRAVAGM